MLDAAMIRLTIGGVLLVAGIESNAGIYIILSVRENKPDSLHFIGFCKKLYFQTKKIMRIRNYLDDRLVKIFEIFLILSKISYCNASLASLSKDIMNRLERVKAVEIDD